MAERSIVTEETKVIRKALKKFGEIPISDNYLNGIIKIKNYRRYQFRNEVDVVFEGGIFVKIKDNNGSEDEGKDEGWYDSSILNHKGYNVSMVKLNRFLRVKMISEVKCRMNYFGIDVSWFYNISKVKWI